MDGPIVRTFLGVLLALPTLTSGCGAPNAPAEVALVLMGDGREVRAGALPVTVDWDAREVLASDGSPMMAFLAYEGIELVADAVAPAEGTLTIGVMSHLGWSIPVVQVPLRAGARTPEGDLLTVYGIVDDRGVAGREKVRRTLVDAASGGYPTRYPDFTFRLSLRWMPQTPEEARPLDLRTIAVRSRARPVEDLYR